jgi:phasin family protein
MAHPSQAQFFGFQQANLDLFVALVGPLARGAEKIGALNMQAVKASLADGSEYARAASQQSVAGVSGFKPELANEFGQKMSAYAGHLNEILTATGAEFAQEAQRQLSTYAAQTQEAFASLGQNILSKANGSTAGSPAWVSAYEAAIKPMRDAMESALPAVAAK